MERNITPPTRIYPGRALEDAPPSTTSRSGSRAAVHAQSNLDRIVVEVSEAERRRLGEEFHDGVGQRLTSIAISAAVIAHRLEERDDALLAEARRMVGLVDEAVLEARTVIRGLYPAGLIEDGLESTLAAMLERIRSTTQLETELIVDGWVTPPPDDVLLHLFRIAQESVHNAVKHAACTRITVRLTEDSDGRRVQILDDGRGLPADAQGGMGLRMMRHRVDVLGGQLNVRRLAEGGTEIEVVLDHPDSSA